MLQMHSYSPVWILMCSVTVALAKNVSPETEQGCGFSAAWTFMCWVNFDLEQKPLPQREQSNGFSPVWVLMWVTTYWLHLKRLRQNEQLKGFSPVWHLMWRLKLSLRANLLLQTEQLNGFSPVWILIVWLLGSSLHHPARLMLVMLHTGSFVIILHRSHTHAPRTGLKHTYGEETQRSRFTNTLHSLFLT